MTGLVLAVVLCAADAPKLSADEQAVLDATNAERKAAGLKPLVAAAKLLMAARGHAENMAKQDTLSHELDGKGMADRVTAAGYEYRAVGENVAAGYATPADAVAGWMKSEGHKKNILNPDFTEVGLAVATTADGKRYWVQVFGAPK